MIRTLSVRRMTQGRVFQLILLVTLLVEARSFSAPTQETNSASPIDLPTALRLVNARNLDVQLARSRLAEARANRDVALEKFFPWLSPSAGYRRHDGRIQDVGGTVFDADKQSYTIGATFAAEADLGDAIYNSLAANQQAHAANFALESQRQEAALAAAVGYYDLLTARSLTEVVREALRISEDYQRQLHDAVAAGLAFKGDELRVQVQTERYRVDLRQAVERQRLAAARLAEILHLDATIELVPADAELLPVTLVRTSTALSSLVAQALHSRPELKEQSSLLAAAHHTQNGAVYGPLVPSVSAQAFLGGLGGGQNGGTDNFGSSQDYAISVGWRIGPGGIFDGARSRFAEARVETTQILGFKLEDSITREVVDADTRLSSLGDQLATTKQTLQTASETLRLSRERKQFGVGAVLEDIQSQQDLTLARAAYVRTVAEYNKAQHTLIRATGGAVSAPP